MGVLLCMKSSYWGAGVPRIQEELRRGHPWGFLCNLATSSALRPKDMSVGPVVPGRTGHLPVMPAGTMWC